MGPRRGAAWGFAGALHVTEQGRRMWLRKGATWGCAGAHWLRKGRGVWLRWDAVRDRAGGLHRAAQGCSVGPRRGAACGCIGAHPGARLGRSCCARGAAWGREWVRPAAARRRFVGLRCAVWGRTGCSVELRTGTALGCARGAERSRGVRLRKVRHLGPRRAAACGGARGATWDCAGAQHAAAQRVQCGAAQGHGTRRRSVRMRRGATRGQGCRGASQQVFGTLVAPLAPHQEVVGVGRVLGKGGRLTTGFWRHPDAAGTSPGGCWRLAASVGGPASPRAFGREGGGGGARRGRASARHAAALERSVGLLRGVAWNCALAQGGAAVGAAPARGVLRAAEQGAQRGAAQKRLMGLR